MSSIKSILSIRTYTIPRYFWVLFMVFSVTSSFLLVDYFRSYVAEITILAVHKNKETSGHAQQVINTLVALPQSLGFYERLLANYPEIKDPWTLLSEKERTQSWADHISMKQIDSSDMMVLGVTAQSASDATFLTEKSANTLFRIAGQFYDIRTDLDLRVIERKEAATVIASPYLWILASVLMGAVVAYVLAWILSKIFQSIERGALRKKEARISLPAQPVELHLNDSMLDDFSDKMPQENGNKISEFMAHQEKIKSGKMEIKKDEKKALDVPSHSLNNLPFLEEGVSLEEHLFGNVSQDTSAESHITHMTEQDAQTKSSEASIDNAILQVEKLKQEPTPEELKKRLNALLRGEL